MEATNSTTWLSSQTKAPNSGRRRARGSTPSPTSYTQAMSLERMMTTMSDSCRVGHPCLCSLIDCDGRSSNLCD